MTVTYAESMLTASAHGTGAALYNPEVLDADEFEADRRRTHLVPTGVKDPVLRDVLDAFQEALKHRLAGMVARISLSSMRAQSAAPLSHGLITAHEHVANYWLPSNYTITLEGVTSESLVLSTENQAAALTCTMPAGFLDVMSGGATGVFQVITAEAVPLISSFHSTQALLPTQPLHKSSHSTRAGEFWRSTVPAPLAVRAVEDIEDWLGVSAAEVFRATGIAKRTYHEWKRTGTRRPRASSEGRLWELHQLAADLVETLGRTGVRSWLNQNPERRNLLRVGAIDKLASEAYASMASTEPRPPWVGAGSPEYHIAPRRDVTFGRMDPGDVVEPES